jgi:hypothetical protein
MNSMLITVQLGALINYKHLIVFTYDSITELEVSVDMCKIA